MKSPYPGFNALIECDNADGYSYDGGFELFKSNISKTDLDSMGDALLILRQLSGESQFKDLESMIVRLEETYNIHRKRNEHSVIQFEHSTNIEGQKWVTNLKQAITNKQVLRIDYRPFGRDNTERLISPYLLKEYNNRWFLIGWDHKVERITNLGMDRILIIKDSIQEYMTNPEFDPSAYDRDIVGVSIEQGGKKQIVKLKVHGQQQYYIESKPLHQSQKTIKKGKTFIIIQLEVIPNFELKAKIMSNVDSIEVISPKSLKDDIIKKMKTAEQIYN